MGGRHTHTKNDIFSTIILLLCCNQSRLEESFKRQADLQRALERTNEEAERGKESSKRARIEWESERDAMKEEITQLRDNLRHSCKLLKTLEGKHQVCDGSPDEDDPQMRGKRMMFCFPSS